MSAHISAVRRVNKELINLYWEIGRGIVEKQRKYGWWENIVEKLSKDLQKTFRDSKGYSAQNLWYMRQIYIEYKDYPKLQQLVGEIPWGHNILIISKVKDFKERVLFNIFCWNGLEQERIVKSNKRWCI